MVIGVSAIVTAANSSVSHNSCPRRAAGHNPQTISSKAVNGTSTNTKCSSSA